MCSNYAYMSKLQECLARRSYPVWHPVHQRFHNTMLKTEVLICVQTERKRMKSEFFMFVTNSLFFVLVFWSYPPLFLLSLGVDRPLVLIAKKMTIKCWSQKRGCHFGHYDLHHGSRVTVTTGQKIYLAVSWSQILNQKSM